MTYEIKNSTASEGLINALESADPAGQFNVKRCGELAAHAIEKLGISKEQAEKCWEYDIDTHSLMLSLVSPENNRMVVLSVKAFPPENFFGDEVMIQVVNATEPADTLGVQYWVKFGNDQNEASELVRTLTVRNHEPRSSIERTIQRLQSPSKVTWGQQKLMRPYTETCGLKSTMEELLLAPVAFPANNSMDCGIPADATAEERIVAETKDVFEAIIAIAGNIRDYTSSELMYVV